MSIEEDLKNAKGYKGSIILSNPVFDFENLITSYLTKLSEFHIDNPPGIVILNRDQIFEFIGKNYGEDFGGCYIPESNIIFINKDNIDPDHTIFHELGHYFYRTRLNNEHKLKWFEYIERNSKFIDFYKICITLGSLQKFTDWFLKSKSNLTVQKLVDLVNYGSRVKDMLSLSEEDKDKIRNFKGKIFTKYETDYFPNEEEVFCEIFAKYMNGKCKHKSNYIFIENLMKDFRI